MRVFVAGATGVIGQYLVPSLVAAGHEVTGTTRSTAKAAALQAAGATPVIVDGLDRRAVLDAVRAAQPDAIVHQMTALASMSSFRNFDKEFAVTNELRTRGTDYLLEAAREAGTRRFIAQSFIGWNNARSGGPVKTEQDPLDPNPLPGTAKSLAAIEHLEQAVPAPVPVWLPYMASCVGAKPPVRAPVWLGRLLAGEMIVEWMAQGRGASNEKAKRELGWTPNYPSWRDGFPVWAEDFKPGKAA